MAAYVRHVRTSHTLFRRSRLLASWLNKNGIHTCQAISRGSVIRVNNATGIRHLGIRPTDQLYRPSVIICGSIPVRWNSSQPGSEPGAIVPSSTEQLVESLPDGYIPEPPPIPVPEVASPSEVVLNALGEPTFSSIGLAHWTPPGLVQSALEMMHVAGDLPWWGAIVAGTVLLRICVFPLVIVAQRNAAQMQNHMPTIQRLQEKFTKTRMTGNPLEAARVGNELQDYMRRNKVKPLRSMMVPLAQMPIFISVFIGLRAMASLPIESMKTGGMFWFTDLTIPDPIYLLPVVTMGTLLATIELGVDGVKAQSMSHTVKWIMRGMPIILLPFIINFPSAMLCYWFTSNIFSLGQVLTLKIPAVRQFFKIPQIVKHTDLEKAQTKKKGFTEGFKDSWSNSRLLAQVEDRQRMDDQRWREAGNGPLQKTYSYDPTKVAQRSMSAKSK